MWLITKNRVNRVNQSKLEANTWGWLWMTIWRDFLWITKAVNIFFGFVLRLWACSQPKCLKKRTRDKRVGFPARFFDCPHWNRLQTHLRNAIRPIIIRPIITIYYFTYGNIHGRTRYHAYINVRGIALGMRCFLDQLSYSFLLSLLCTNGLVRMMINPRFKSLKLYYSGLGKLWADWLKVLWRYLHTAGETPHAFSSPRKQSRNTHGYIHRRLEETTLLD